MLKKQYLKRGTVKVDFVLPSAIAAEASSAYLVGDFNNWDESATPMTKLKNGTFKVTLSWSLGAITSFRYC